MAITAVLATVFLGVRLQRREVVALGVPLVSSRTGIIEQVITQPEFLFQPHQPGDLAQTLRHLQRHWRVTPFDASGAQRRIREHFLIDHTVEKLTAAYRQLLGDR